MVTCAKLRFGPSFFLINQKGPCGSYTAVIVGSTVRSRVLHGDHADVKLSFHFPFTFFVCVPPSRGSCNSGNNQCIFVKSRSCSIHIKPVLVSGSYTLNSVWKEGKSAATVLICNVLCRLHDFWTVPVGRLLLLTFSFGLNQSHQDLGM